MLAIVNWNIAENIVWYVRLADVDGVISVELFLTQADAEAQTNMQASGSGSYGTSQSVALVNTHAAISRQIMLGTHLPSIEVGDIARLMSARRGVDDYGQISEHSITGTPDSLISDVEARKYLELKR
jgi:hypothetical protein